ncbi:MAG: Gfo/Idh/MocA family oxidoreductase [Verrucomicrobiales bacterium]|nr:Gfo/Idh/MocA family oxidoreductase [Verrucomicrobiales bacterium]
MKKSLFKLLIVSFALITLQTQAQDKKAPIKVGIIGIDAHAPSWTKLINDPKAEGELADMTIVAAFPAGSPDIPQSVELLAKAREPMEKLGVEMVDSIDALIKKSDVVMILSIDGRTHLQQAIPVIEAGKTLYIDKPIAASVSDALKIYRLAEAKKVPVFTSSSLRYAKGAIDIHKDPKLGDIIGAEVYSPCKTEPNHPDFFWYGIHGVEPLFTIMGQGCQSVTRIHTEGTDVAVGIWDGGRIGTYRGIRAGKRGYGATVFGTKGVVQGGGFDGYAPLIVEIGKFFKTGKPPVSEAETLQVLAFMEAADESKRQGGKPVTIESVMKKAHQEAAK